MYILPIYFNQPIFEINKQTKTEIKYDPKHGLLLITAINKIPIIQEPIIYLLCGWKARKRKTVSRKKKENGEGKSSRELNALNFRSNNDVNLAVEIAAVAHYISSCRFMAQSIQIKI